MIRLIILVTSLVVVIGVLFLPTDVSNDQASNNRKKKKFKKGSEN